VASTASRAATPSHGVSGNAPRRPEKSPKTNDGPRLPSELLAPSPYASVPCRAPRPVTPRSLRSPPRRAVRSRDVGGAGTESNDRDEVEGCQPDRSAAHRETKTGARHRCFTWYGFATFAFDALDRCGISVVNERRAARAISFPSMTLDGRRVVRVSTHARDEDGRVVICPRCVSGSTPIADTWHVVGSSDASSFGSHSAGATATCSSRLRGSTVVAGTSAPGGGDRAELTRGRRAGAVAERSVCPSRPGPHGEALTWAHDPPGRLRGRRAARPGDRPQGRALVSVVTPRRAPCDSDERSRRGAVRCGLKNATPTMAMYATHPTTSSHDGFAL
jgi:hypothetical protein